MHPSVRNPLILFAIAAREILSFRPIIGPGRNPEEDARSFKILLSMSSLIMLCNDIIYLIVFYYVAFWSIFLYHLLRKYQN